MRQNVPRRQYGRARMPSEIPEGTEEQLAEYLPGECTTRQMTPEERIRYGVDEETITVGKIKALHSQGLSGDEIAKKLKTTKRTVLTIARRNRLLPGQEIKEETKTMETKTTKEKQPINKAKTQKEVVATATATINQEDAIFRLTAAIGELAERVITLETFCSTAETLLNDHQAAIEKCQENYDTLAKEAARHRHQIGPGHYTETPVGFSL